jgi:hypothetical protein
VTHAQLYGLLGVIALAVILLVASFLAPLRAREIDEAEKFWKMSEPWVYSYTLTMNTVFANSTHQVRVSKGRCEARSQTWRGADRRKPKSNADLQAGQWEPDDCSGKMIPNILFELRQASARPQWRTYVTFDHFFGYPKKFEARWTEVFDV